ncbi:MAG: hypothetical protein EG825_03370 [Rhodocyclaceae bacterium]|nr:hypothetical protein [Rhodocyclaceae bacterium]
MTGRPMASINHYSIDRAKRSLLHFGIGKAASAGLGIVVLVMAVRLLPPKDYGIYIALIAFLELFYVVTGFGLSTVAQRYVAEFRMKAHPAQFRKFLLRVVALRMLLACVSALAVSIVSQPLVALLGLELSREAQWLFVALLIFGSGTRYFDEVFPSLLLQGYTQGLVFISNAVKMVVLAAALMLDSDFGYREILWLELGTAFLVYATGASLLGRYLSLTADATTGEAEYVNDRMWPVAARFYLVQLIGQAYGPNAVKLLLSKIMGLVETATFGFLQALADMIRNYLPAYLLATWVRPLMISRYLQRRDMGEVSAIANVVFKLSLMGVVPFAVFFSAHGDRFAGWVSSGKYVEAATVLTLLMGLIALQSLHAVMSMVTVTVERAGANVVATCVCCTSLPLAVWFSRYWGLAGIVGAMALAECLWVGIVWGWLARGGLTVRFDVLGPVKIFVSGLIVAVAIRFVGGGVAEGWTLMLHLMLGGLGVLAIAAVLKPFSTDERVIIGRLIPARFFFW